MRKFDDVAVSMGILCNCVHVTAAERYYIKTKYIVSMDEATT